MPSSNLVISHLYDVLNVSFRDASLLDGVAVEAVGRELYDLVDKQAHRKILLDFGSVRFLSSTMLGVLVSLHKKSVAIKGKVVI